MISYKQIELLNEAYSKMNGVSGSFGSYTIVQKIESIIDYIKSRSGSIDDVTEVDFDYKVFMLLIEIINWLDDNGGGGDDDSDVIVHMNSDDADGIPGYSIYDFDNKQIYANGLIHTYKNDPVKLIYSGTFGLNLFHKNYESFPQLNLKDSVNEIRDLIKFDNFNMITKIDKPLINIAQNGVLTSLEGNIIIKDGLHFSLVSMKEDLINKYINVFFLPNGFIFTLKFEGSGHVYIEVIGENISLGGSERGFKFENPSQISNLFIDGQSRDVNNNPGVGFYGFECKKIEFDFVS